MPERIGILPNKNKILGLATRLCIVIAIADGIFVYANRGSSAMDGIDELIKDSHKDISISPNRKYVAYQDEDLDKQGHGSRVLKIIDENGKLTGKFEATDQESIDDIEWSTDNKVFFVYSFSSNMPFTTNKAIKDHDLYDVYAMDPETGKIIDVPPWPLLRH